MGCGLNKGFQTVVPLHGAETEEDNVDKRPLLSDVRPLKNAKEWICVHSSASKVAGERKLSEFGDPFQLPLPFKGSN